PRRGYPNEMQRQARRPGLKPLPGAVARSTVDHHDLIRRARLGGNRLQQRVDRVSLVEHRDDQRGAFSGLTASHGNRPASLARSPPLATLTVPLAAQGTASFQYWSVARWARTTTLFENSCTAVGRP